jgi:CDP-diacylglycerol--serine O-phosphatidyltransferase
LLIIKGKFEQAVYLMTGSVIMDGFDGTVARLTKTESNFGVQLDSLVDAVAFGLVGSIMIYMWGFQYANPSFGKVIAFLFLSAGVIRLARFNVLKEAHAVPANIFVGLPIPLGALSIASPVLIFGNPLKDLTHATIYIPYVILVSLLMVSTIKYKTMKRLRSQNNLLILLFLAIIIAFGINFPRYTIPAISLLYLISPLIFHLYGKIRKTTPHSAPVASATDAPENHDKR